jgi:hypothetical protein
LKEKLVLLFIIAIIAPTAEYLLLPSYTSIGPTMAVTKIYSTSLQKGMNIRVDVTVSDLSDVIAYSTSLAFDPSVLKVKTGDPHGKATPGNGPGIFFDIYEGPFLRSASNSTEFIVDDVNNQKGTITIISDFISVSSTGASGSGIVASINFTCVNSTTNTAINITGPVQGHSLVSISPSMGGGTETHKDIDGFITGDGQPGVWTELWFQATLIVFIVEVMVVALGILVTVRWWHSEGKAEREDAAVLEDLAR